MTEVKSRTQLLTPDEAAALVCAATGLFSIDKESQVKGEHSYQAIQDRLALAREKGIEDPQRLYVEKAVSKISCSLRSIEIIHKGRENNFKEIEKLRAEYLKEIKSRLDFGNKLTDLARSLPTMAVSGVGVTTLADIIKSYSSYPDIWLWFIGIAGIAIGYWIQIFINRWVRRRKQALLIKQDFDRNCYFRQYVNKVEVIVVDLYYELERVHRDYFGRYFNSNPEKVETHVRGIFNSWRPTFCKYLNEHFETGLITPDVWAKCETGDLIARDTCPHWH